MVIGGLINFSEDMEIRIGRYVFNISLLINNRRIKAYTLSLGNNRSKIREQPLKFNYIKRCT